MSTPFKAVLEAGVLKLSGILDETADLKPVHAAFAQGGELHIDFTGVARINSCGVRDWVLALQKSTCSPIVYEGCSLVIVKQLNAVPDFQGRAQVLNFFAPYFCEKCDLEKLVILNSADIRDGAPPVRTCERCSMPMKFDAIPTQYLGFLKRKSP